MSLDIVPTGRKLSFNKAVILDDRRNLILTHVRMNLILTLTSYMYRHLLPFLSFTAAFLAYLCAQSITVSAYD